MFLVTFTTWLRSQLTKDESGANMVEYVLLVALIALAAVAAVVFLRQQIVDVLYAPSGSRLSSL